MAWSMSAFTHRARQWMTSHPLLSVVVLLFGVAAVLVLTWLVMVIVVVATGEGMAGAAAGFWAFCLLTGALIGLWFTLRRA